MTPPQKACPACVVKKAPALCSADLECKTNELCENEHCVDVASIAECRSLRVHFDFDKSELKPDSQQLLAKFSRCMKAQPTAHFVVAGNSDERGTEEYNLALGDRRSTSVIRYLESLGAADGQLRSVSYGKLQPLCGGQ